MAALSGKYGAVDSHTGVRNWSIGVQSNAPSYRASNTNLGTGRVKGVEDWSGSFEQITSFPALFPGDTFTFKGFCGAADGSSTGTGVTWSGLAIVSEVAITWDWRSNEIMSSTTTFESKGALTITPADDNVSDTSVPDLSSICGIKVEFYNVTPAWVTWDNIARVDLRLRSENPTFVNSSTISGSDCYVSRTQGPLDFDLDILEDNTEFSDPSTSFPGDIGTDSQIRIYTNATEFWALKWCHLDAVSDLNVNIETGEVISRTMNFKKNGYVGGVEGHIINPTPTTKWGTT